MSWTQDAGSYFAPLNYTTSFTNPAQWTMGQNAYTSGLGQDYLGGLLKSTQASEQHTADLISSSVNLMNEATKVHPSGGGGGSNANAVNNFVYGGGGYNFPSIPDYSGGTLAGGTGPRADFSQTFNMPSVFDFGTGGAAGGGFGGIPKLDWGNLFQSPPQQSSRSPFDAGASAGAGMFGGLGGAGAQPGAGLDWTKLYQGGAKQDPTPGMSMPGGLNQSMAQPQPQQQPIDYGSLFGRGVGGKGGAPPSISQTAPALMPGAAEQGAGMFGGLGGVGGLPSQTPQQAGGTTFNDRFNAAPQPQPVPEPQQQTGGATFNERFGAAPTSATPPPPPPPETGALSAGGLGANATPAQLIEQSRSRLAGLLAPYDQPSLEQFQKGAPTPVTAEQLPGEAGRGGMTGQPQTAAETLYPNEMPDKIPLPTARPAAADESDATKVYPGENPPRPGMIVPQLGKDYRGRDVTMVEQRLRRAVEGGAQFLPPGYSIEPTSGYIGRETSQGQHSGKHAEDFQIRGPDGVIPNSGHDYSGMYTQLARGVKTWVAQNDPSLDRDMRWGAAFETSKGSGRGDTMHFDTGMAHGTPYQGNLNPNSQWVGLQPLSAAEQGAMPAYIPLLGENQVPLDGRVPTGRGSSYSANPARFGGDFGASEFSGQDPSAGSFTPYEGWRQGGRLEDRTAEQIGQDNLRALEQRGFGYDPRLTPERPLTPLGEEAGLNTLAGGKYTPEPSGTLPSDRLSTDAVNETARRLWSLPPRDPNSPVQYSTANPLVNITKQDISDAANMAGAFTGDTGGRIAKLAIGGGAIATPGVDTSLSDQPHPDPTELLRGVGTSNVAPLFSTSPQPGGNRFDEAFAAFEQPIEGEAGRGGMIGRDQLASVMADPGTTPTRSISERAPSPAAEEKQRLYGGVGAPGQYSGFEQPYGQKFSPGAATREMFENRADYTAQDQAEELAAQRTIPGAQLARDPAMERRLIDTITAEVGSGSSDTVKAALVESLFNRQGIRLSGPRNTVDPATGLDFSDLNRLGLLSTGQSSYYEPFHSVNGRVPTINAAHAEVERSPEYAAHVRDIIAQVIAGSNVSNLASENASDTRTEQMGTWARNEQSPGWYDPGPLPRETFARYDVIPHRPVATNHPNPDDALVDQAQTWLRALQPSGYVDPLSRADRWQAITNNPYGRR